MRLTGTDIDVYRYLEPLYNDYRKLRRQLADGSKLYTIFLDDFFFFLQIAQVVDMHNSYNFSTVVR